MWEFIAGLVVGAILGITIIAILVAGRDDRR